MRLSGARRFHESHGCLEGGGWGRHSFCVRWQMGQRFVGTTQGRVCCQSSHWVIWQLHRLECPDQKVLGWALGPGWMWGGSTNQWVKCTWWWWWAQGCLSGFNKTWTVLNFEDGNFFWTAYSLHQVRGPSCPCSRCIEGGDWGTCHKLL